MKKNLNCPFGSQQFHKVIRKGSFRRQCDGKLVRRYFCKDCQKGFSAQTFQPTYRQQKVLENSQLELLLVSGVSKRRAARLLRLSPNTVARRCTFLATRARERQTQWLSSRKNPFSAIQFDDLETFEHTRLKPLSVPLVVEEGTRLIIASGVARMPAKGKLAEKSRKKYGRRQDMRSQAWDAVLACAALYSEPASKIISDENPHYPRHLSKHFPKATCRTTPGGRGCVVGYGELKRKCFDPMFSLNHTCAMLRDNIACLKRRTWTTTKKPEELQKLIDIYIWYHNKVILSKIILPSF